LSPYWNILGSVSPYLDQAECSGFLEALEEIVRAVAE